jgi:uncharacterized protein
LTTNKRKQGGFTMIGTSKHRSKASANNFFKFFVLVVFLLIIPANAFSSDFPKSVSVVSPAPGATVHMVLIGMGTAVKQVTPIENWIVQPLGGPVSWLPLMKARRADFANHNAADLLNAYLGNRGAYQEMEPQTFLRTVGAGHEYMFMFWTTPDTGIKSIADLKGKRAFITQKGNPMFTQMAEAQLNSAGLSFDDLRANMGFASIAEAIRGLIEGRVDAIMYPVVPSAVMQVNEAKGECIFVPLTKEQAQFVVERIPGYTVQDIPAEDPRFRNKSAVPNAVCYQNAMFTHEDMDAEVVYAVTKAIFDHNDLYKDSHPVAKYWSLDYNPIALTIPYHDGAIKFFKEKGLWTPEAEEYQQKIMQKTSR